MTEDKLLSLIQTQIYKLILKMVEKNITTGAQEAIKILEKENWGMITAPDSVVRKALENFQGRTQQDLENVMKWITISAISQESKNTIEQLLQSDIDMFSQKIVT